MQCSVTYLFLAEGRLAEGLGQAKSQTDELYGCVHMLLLWRMFILKREKDDATHTEAARTHTQVTFSALLVEGHFSESKELPGNSNIKALEKKSLSISLFT